MKNRGGSMAAITIVGLFSSSILAQAAPVTSDNAHYVLEVSDFDAAQQIAGDHFSIGDHNFVTVEGAATAAVYQGTEGVLSVEPEHTRHIALTPNDADFSLQWHHFQANDQDIDSTDAWDSITGSSSVVVAIVDSGVDTDHPDLAANIWVNTDEIADNGIDDDANGFIDDVNGWDFVDSDNDPNPAPDGIDDDADGDVDGGVTHGTHVAGLIGAVGNNGVGVSGVSWTVQLMPVRALDDEGAGFDQDITQAIEYATDNGADVINMSLGAYGNSTELQDGVDYAQSHGVLVVAAAGNDALSINSSPFYPACSTDVIGVAATNASDQAAYFSNFGSDCVDLAAPGSYMLSTLYSDDSTYGFTSDYGYLSGTSMATPVVAGAAALLLAANPDLSASDITTALTSSTDDISLGTEYGTGRLNVATAVANAVSLPVISAFTTSSESTSISSGTRTTESTPYFSWTAGDDADGIAGYWVYFGKNPTANPETAGSFQTTTYLNHSSALSGNDQSYYLRIKLQDSLGHVTNSTSSFEYLLDNKVAKAKPVTVSETSGGLKITWTKVTDEHVSEYVIRRSAHGKKQYSSIDQVSSKKSTYTDITVNDGKKYDYKIKAVDTLGNKSVTAAKSKQFNGVEWLVMGSGAGQTPKVLVYDPSTGAKKSSFVPFPSNMTQGVEVAVGDVDGDGEDEIVCGTGDGANPLVRVFEADGSILGSFYPYDATSKTGVRIGTADTNKDGVDEVVTVPGPGATPLVRRFSGYGMHLGTDFYALDGKFTGGAFITGVDFNGDGKDELAIGAGPGGGAQVTVNTAKTGVVEANFFAYDQYTFKGGIRVARADTDGVEGEEIVTVPALGTSHTQMFAREPGEVKQLNPGFFPYDPWYTTGFNITALDIQQKGTDQLSIGTGFGMLSEAVVYDKTGSMVLDIDYPFNNYSGVHVAGGFFRL